jgi:hypothetical protein
MSGLELLKAHLWELRAISREMEEDLNDAGEWYTTEPGVDVDDYNARKADIADEFSDMLRRFFEFDELTPESKLMSTATALCTEVDAANEDASAFARGGILRYPLVRVSRVEHQNKLASIALRFAELFNPQLTKNQAKEVE